MRSADSDIDRLLSFEVESTIYALPITAVLEVAESNRATVVPGLAREVAAAMNWHGEVLPLLASPLLLKEPLKEPSKEPLKEPLEEEASAEGTVEVEANEASAADDAWAAAGLCRSEELTESLCREGDAMPIERAHVLVVAGRSEEAPSLGMPVDRVLGLVDGAAVVGDSEETTLVVEKRTVDGQVVNVLDPQRLVARAAGLIESAAV